MISKILDNKRESHRTSHGRIRVDSFLRSRFEMYSEHFEYSEMSGLPNVNRFKRNVYPIRSEIVTGNGIGQ